MRSKAEKRTARLDPEICEWLDDRRVEERAGHWSGDRCYEECCNGGGAQLKLGVPTLIKHRRYHPNEKRERISGILVGTYDKLLGLRRGRYVVWIHLDTVYSVTQEG